MAKRKPSGAIKEPTLRKIRSRGFIPIKYWMDSKLMSGIYFGWIVKEDDKSMTIRLASEDKNRIIKGKERKFITRLE